MLAGWLVGWFVPVLVNADDCRLTRFRYLAVLVVERITGRGADPDDDLDEVAEDDYSDQLVSFVDFAQWYTFTAHDDFSWLELLYVWYA